MLKVDVEMFVASWHTHCVRQQQVVTVSETAVSCEPNYKIGVYSFCGAAAAAGAGGGFFRCSALAPKSKKYTQPTMYGRRSQA